MVKRQRHSPILFVPGLVLLFVVLFGSAWASPNDSFSYRCTNGHGTAYLLTQPGHSFHDQPAIDSILVDHDYCDDIQNCVAYSCGVCSSSSMGPNGSQIIDVDGGHFLRIELASRDDLAFSSPPYPPPQTLLQSELHPVNARQRVSAGQ